MSVRVGQDSRRHSSAEDLHIKILCTACYSWHQPLNKISLTSPVFWYTHVQGLSRRSLLAHNPLVMSVISLCGCVFFNSENLSLPFGMYGVVSLFSVEPVLNWEILLPCCPKQSQGAGRKKKCLLRTLLSVFTWHAVFLSLNGE